MHCIHYKEKNRRGERVFVTVEYFDKNPKTYQEGDYVQVFGQPFRAKKKHIASESFLEDATEDSLWTQVTPAEIDAHHAEELAYWSPGLPGEEENICYAIRKRYDSKFEINPA